jgi:small subunit ribosomal protein S15
MLTSKEKEKVMEGVKTHKEDTGSPEVQVALLSKEIDKLLLHLKKHAKDFHSKRGLLRMVARRRTILSFLKRENEKRYRSLLRKLGLKSKP